MSITSVNLDKFEQAVSSMPGVARRAARLSTNDAARRARAKSATEMMKQVAFPTGYLGTVRNGNLRIAKFAKSSDLTAEVQGRFRPTSLARFTLNKSEMLGKNRRGPARVQVRPGRVKTIERAFLMRLKRGMQSAAGAGVNANLGLAIRLHPGERVENKKQMVAMGRGVYLLYGPSVNQVFRAVAKDVAPEVGSYFNTEFSRQFRRLYRGG